MTERQVLAQERTTLLAQIAAYQRHLDATPTRSQEERERLWKQVRRDQVRIAGIEARLRQLVAE